MKKITVCGSYKFQKEMKEIALKLELMGNCVSLQIKAGLQKQRNNRRNGIKRKLYDNPNRFNKT